MENCEDLMPKKCFMSDEFFTMFSKDNTYDHLAFAGFRFAFRGLRCSIVGPF